VGVSQTLRRWTEGATYVRQGDHHVGHWPTFLVFSVFLSPYGRLSGISSAFQHTLKSKESGCAALGSLLSSYSTEWPESSQAKASSIVNCRQKQLHIFSERLNYLLFTTTITTYARIHGATILVSGSRCISNGKKKYIKIQNEHA